MDTAGRIANIIHKRNESVKPLLREEERCVNVMNVLDKLQASMSSFVRGKDDDNPTIQNCAKFLENIPRIKQQIVQLQEKISRCRRRFDRGTINIGFGGKRGQGKSFLLQKFSGLSDSEVPSGSGKTVTAVRSEIFNDENSFAEITFYDKSAFLRDVIAPYCAQLNIATPASFEEFGSLKFPDAGEFNELQVPYLKKLLPLQKNAREYAGLLTGESKIENDFSKLRQYVAYTDDNGNDSYTYAAVKRVVIHTPFPETDVRQLGLIDLPGLGELNPTVEARHTSGFGDEVDLVMLIRRPVGPRVDWDDEDHKALGTLDAAIKDGALADFVVLVQNEGGCDPKLAEIAIQSIRDTISDRLSFLRTSGDNSKSLTDDVLSPVLDKLAKTLPEADRKLLDGIEASSAKLWKDIANYSGKAIEILKKLNDRGYPEEEMQIQAEANRDRLAALLEDASIELDNNIRENHENEQLIASIEAIRDGLKTYVQNGMEFGSKDAWIKRNADRIATAKNIGDVFTDTAHQLRVRIAEDFTSLDDVYCVIVDDLLDIVASKLDEVLPGFLKGNNGREKLAYFRERLQSEDKSFDNLVEALDFLLNLKIDHRTQFYPRAYEPIRAFMEYVKDDSNFPEVEGKNREEKAIQVYEQLSDVADRVVLEIVDKLNEETLRLNDILFVALEYFDDKIIRSQSAMRHWERFIKTFYPEIYGSDQEASESAALGTIMDQLGELKRAAE